MINQTPYLSSHTQSKGILTGLNGQGGYSFIIFMAALAALTAMYLSMAFIQDRRQKWNLNYALGEQYAAVARAAHYYVQYSVFGPSYDPSLTYETMINNELPTEITLLVLENEGYLPADFANNFDAMMQKSFGGGSLTIYPMPAPYKGSRQAPSAYVVLKVGPDGVDNIRQTYEIAAFQAGASAQGMARLGMPTSTEVESASSEIKMCNTTDVAFVRWGNAEEDCLTVADLMVITNSKEDGTDFFADDVIAPAWEAARAKLNTNAIMRYPQPNLASANIMEQQLTFDVDPLTSVRPSIIGTNYADINKIFGIPVSGSVIPPDETPIRVFTFNADNDDVSSLTFLNNAILQGNVDIDGDLVTKTAVVGTNDTTLRSINVGNVNAMGENTNVNLPDEVQFNVTGTVVIAPNVNTKIGDASNLSDINGDGLELELLQDTSASPAIPGVLAIKDEMIIGDGGIEITGRLLSPYGFDADTITVNDAAGIIGAQNININESTPGNSDGRLEIDTMRTGSLILDNGGGDASITVDIITAGECYGACPTDIDPLPDGPL